MIEKELWARGDLRNTLAATYIQNAVTPVSGIEQEAYQRGFHAALAVLAVAFGLPTLSDEILRRAPSVRVWKG